MRAILQRKFKKEGKLVAILRYIPPVCIFISDHPCILLEKQYQKEMEDRGAVPKEYWSSYKIDHDIKDIFDRILKHRMWSQKVDFHPDDPYYVIGGLQTGDLSEVDVLMDLEDEFKIKLTEDVFDSWSKMNYSGVLESLTSMVQPNQAVKPSP